MTQKELNAKFDQLVSDNNNAYISVLNPGKQCFDVVAEWCKRLGIPNYPGNPSPFPYANASQIYTDYRVFQAQYFEQIPNTPEYIPQKGDIVVWSKDLNGGIGHVAVATGEGTQDWFNSFDQNWKLGSPAQIVKHDYKFVLGALRLRTTPAAMNTLPTELQQYSTNWRDLAIKDQLDVNSPEFSDYREIDKIISDKLSAQAAEFETKIKALNNDLEDVTLKLSERDIDLKALNSSLEELKASTTTELAKYKDDMLACQNKQPIIKTVETPIIKKAKNKFISSLIGLLYALDEKQNEKK